MNPVSITTLRQHLPSFIERVSEGETFLVTVRGKVMARLIPEQDESEAALGRLLSYRTACTIGDVLSADNSLWGDADDHL